MQDKYIGARLDGRYEVQELIGEGGMANVYKGVDLQARRTVAIKILRDELRRNEELVRRFVNESRAISVLNHANIVKVFDVGVGSQVQYIVMEYLNGITLKEYIEQRSEPLTFRESVHFMVQVLRALQHAHDKGIVHRDIKPQNIMMLEGGTLKVMDFGIARLARSEIHTATDQAIGSVHYISPEQARGEVTDSRSDIYSAGIVLYEMLSGRLPFESDNAVAIAMKQISDEAVPLDRINPSLPVGLQEITERAMCKDPRNRYQSAMDMLRDIEAFRQNPNIRFDYEPESIDSTRYNSNMAKKPSGTAAGTRTRKTKKKRGLLIPVTAGITGAVVLVCAILCIVVFATSPNSPFGNVPTIELPNFVGMHIDDAKVILAGSIYKNLRVEYIEQSSEIYPPGQIISQNPTSSSTNPKEIKATQKVEIVYSVGIKVVVVPDLTGFTRKEAQDAVLALGVRPYIKGIEDPSQPVGRVLYTEPAAGNEIEVRQDTMITIYICIQKVDTERVVPDLVGIASVGEAAKLAQDSQLGVQELRQEYSSEPVGSIIRQSPEGGAVVPVFTTIYVITSKGPEPAAPATVVVPDFVGLQFTQAVTLANTTGLVLSEIPQETTDPNEYGKVLNQSIPLGSVVLEGSTVVVTVGKPSASSPPSDSSGAPSSSASANMQLPQGRKNLDYMLPTPGTASPLAAEQRKGCK